MCSVYSAGVFYKKKLEIQGSGYSGEGQFYFQGTSEFSPDRKMTLNITGKNIEIYNTAHLNLIASPEVTLEYVNQIFFLQGTVHIPKASITMRDQKNTALLSKDIVLTTESGEPLHPFKIIPSLYVIIDNQLHFKGYGIDGIVGGKLAIDERPDGLLSGSGRLTIKEGKYRLQGATRYIHHGRLLFPPGTLLNDPLLDIRISQNRPEQQAHSVSDADVGIYVQGTLQKPIFHPYSNAHLQNKDILSRLGFGGPETPNDENQRQVLSQTAFLFAGNANPFVEHLQNNLGLEEFNLESRQTHKSFYTQGGTETFFVVGKPLSRKLYLQYQQNVLEPISTIRLKYALSRHFTTSLETGTEGLGGDLIFSMERD